MIRVQANVMTGPREMKARISEPDGAGGILWEGEALSINWNRTRGEFIIRGTGDRLSFSEVLTRMVEMNKLIIDVEDPESTQLVWRGRVGSARFRTCDTDEIECSLVMSLDDWFGVFPGFSSFYFC